MHFVLPTSGHDLPCVVPKFKGIRAVIAQPAYSVFPNLRIETGDRMGYAVLAIKMLFWRK